ncbi:helix-turn-helix domain-containing protein [Streptosporangium canum]|uniref:ArsR/SmtB family transcription factor n=1 Tax=Streptosporangium canum TaxID=324952 RepID=UPI0034343FE0
MEIKDPKAMRALAHPLRMQLLELLAVEGAATATRLGELLDESPSNCSFHLRVLAKHGYIEPAPGRTGRNRPWRLIDIHQSWTAEQHDEAGRTAASALSAALLEWECSRMKAAVSTPAPEAWKGKPSSGGATLWLTPEETEQIGREIDALLTPYTDRWRDQESRPAEGRPVRVFHNIFLLPNQDQS